MLYDRPYMKASYKPRTQRLGVLAWLLITLLVVFMMQNIIRIFFGSPSYERAIVDVFSLSSDAVAGGKVWTLLTYALLHDTSNILHILSNLLGLFFIGRMVNRIFGDRAIVEVFILSTLTGGLLALLVHMGDNAVILGASGALMGLLTLFCLARPNEEITLLLYFIFPITLKPKWILWATIAISSLGMLFHEIPGTHAVAHSAHLGGVLGGFLYYLLVSRGKTLRSLAPKVTFKTTTATPPPAPAKAPKVSYSINFSNKEKLRSEVDRILDKINSNGFGSLTQEERDTLDKARDILKK
jgi:membrane associated rhomboid family serine protease